MNLIHCYRSMNYISRHMEEAYGIPCLNYDNVSYIYQYLVYT
jgi:nitrogenase molybdenum-iron protein alpha chain